MSITHHALLLFVPDISTADIKKFALQDEIQDTEFEKFGVSDAQQLVQNAHLRPAATKGQLCVVRAQFITLEAQNALLKVFEEPPQSTKFLLIVPKDFIVIPTLRSRCEIVAVESTAQDDALFSDFLTASFAQRLALIDMAQKKKDTHWQRSIKKGLIEYLETHTEHLKELEYTARLLLTRGASNKFLLEHAALTMPSRTKS
jgi:DNA polymerase III delta prime subunit